jgi:hypothetical protein
MHQRVGGPVEFIEDLGLLPTGNTDAAINYFKLHSAVGSI